MTEDEIIFFCTECGTQLAVAAELAGVEGPCPACSAQIKAPEVSTKAVVPDLPPVPVSAGHLFPKMIGTPRQVEIDFGLDDLAAYEEVDTEFAAFPDFVKELPALTDEQVKVDLPNLAPEPKPEPVVSEGSFLGAPEIWVKDDLRSSSWYAKPWVWGLAAVVVAMAVLLADVFKITKDPVPGAVMPASSSPVFELKTPEPEIVKPEVVKQLEIPEVNPAAAPVLVKLKAIPLPIVPDEIVPEKKVSESLVVPSPIEDPPKEIIQVKPKSAARLAVEEKLHGLDARLILDLFLNVKTLDERVPLMFSRTASDELELSCLAKPLLPVTRTQLEYRDVDSQTGVVDSYFSVLFEGSASLVNPQILLVRQQREEPAKVLVDPFLDLYGGRLMAFAAKPVEQTKTFEVYVSALAHCKDPEVPGYQSKMTLSLQAQDHGAVLAKAYFDKKSKIAELLEDGTFRLSYGQPIPCRVLLKWNVSENPSRPYLEAVEIKAFEWGAQ